MSNNRRLPRATRKRDKHKYASIGKVKALKNARSLGRYAKYTKRRRVGHRYTLYRRQKGGWKHDELLMAAVQYGKEHGILYPQSVDVPQSLDADAESDTQMGGTPANGKFEVGDTVVLQTTDAANIKFGVYEAFRLVGKIDRITTGNPATATLKIPEASIEAMDNLSGKIATIHNSEFDIPIGGVVIDQNTNQGSTITGNVANVPFSIDGEEYRLFPRDAAVEIKVVHNRSNEDPNFKRFDPVVIQLKSPLNVETQAGQYEYKISPNGIKGAIVNDAQNVVAQNGYVEIHYQKQIVKPVPVGNKGSFLVPIYIAPAGFKDNLEVEYIEQRVVYNLIISTLHPLSMLAESVITDSIAIRIQAVAAAAAAAAAANNMGFNADTAVNDMFAAAATAAATAARDAAVTDENIQTEIYNASGTNPANLADMIRKLDNDPQRIAKAIVAGIRNAYVGNPHSAIPAIQGFVESIGNVVSDTLDDGDPAVTAISYKINTLANYIRGINTSADANQIITQIEGAAFLNNNGAVELAKDFIQNPNKIINSINSGVNRAYNKKPEKSIIDTTSKNATKIYQLVMSVKNIQRRNTVITNAAGWANAVIAAANVRAADVRAADAVDGSDVRAANVRAANVRAANVRAVDGANAANVDDIDFHISDDGSQVKSLKLGTIFKNVGNSNNGSVDGDDNNLFKLIPRESSRERTRLNGGAVNDAVDAITNQPQLQNINVIEEQLKKETTDKYKKAITYLLSAFDVATKTYEFLNNKTPVNTIIPADSYELRHDIQRANIVSDLKISKDKLEKVRNVKETIASPSDFGTDLLMYMLFLYSKSLSEKAEAYASEMSGIDVITPSEKKVFEWFKSLFGATTQYFDGWVELKFPDKIVLDQINPVDLSEPLTNKPAGFKTEIASISSGDYEKAIGIYEKIRQTGAKYRPTVDKQLYIAAVNNMVDGLLKLLKVAQKLKTVPRESLSKLSDTKKYLDKAEEGSAYDMAKKQFASFEEKTYPELMGKHDFDVGDRVMGNYLNRGKWYEGIITVVNPDNTYNVHYDDGDKEANIPINRLRGLDFPHDTDSLLSAIKNPSKEVAKLSKEVAVLETAKITQVSSEDVGIVNTIKLDMADKTKQITHVLPFMMQIYEDIFDSTNHEGKTEVDGHRIPNSHIMRFAANKINEIEKKHPHPELFDKLYYYWDMFNVGMALHLLESYMDAVGQMNPSKVVPGQIITTIEKSLANVPDTTNWDNDLSIKKKYRMRTKIVGPDEPVSEYINNNLMMLTSTKPVNPVMSTISQSLKFDKESGIIQPISKVLPVLSSGVMR